jgi:hypothetical protein
VEQEAPFVFVSVARKDRERAGPLMRHLQALGIPVRRFEDVVAPGAAWRDEFSRLLEEAAAVLVVWSETSRRSDWVPREADLAAQAGKYVPVTLDGLGAIPRPFAEYQTVDLTRWSGIPEEPEFQRLVSALEAKLSAPAARDGPEAAEPFSKPPSTDPFLGFAPSAVAVLRHADGLRRALGRGEVHMEHLVEALFQEGTARRLLQGTGIAHEELLRIIDAVPHAVFPPDVRVAELDAVPPLSKHVAEAVGNARARARGSPATVDAQALLWGLLGVDQCRLVKALRERGVRQEAVDQLPPEGPREHVDWLDDEPVGLDADTLGRRGVAVTLESQLRKAVEKHHVRSFLVHVDGAWGAGKSSLLRFLRELMSEPTGSGAGKDLWLCVDYDAWRQSRVGPPWLTLLQAVRSAVRSDRRWWRRAPFFLRERGRLVSSWQWTALVLVTLLTVALILLVTVTADGGISVTQWGDVVKLIGGLVPVVAGGWLLAGLTGRFLSLDSRRAARAFVDNRADPMEDLATHFQWVLRQARRPVLLLIDDLDRCPESFVVELLDAVQKLMREPHPIRPGRPAVAGGRRAAVPTLVVVVAADGRWIRQAYDNAFASLDKAVREPGATIGSLFLEKLFQLTLPVPQLPEQLKKDYFTRILSDNRATPADRSAPALAERVAAAPHDQLLEVLAEASRAERLQVADLAIDRLVVEEDAQRNTTHALEPFGELLDPTPRAMKRFVMAYSVLRAVRTAEGSVVGLGPLALWTVVLTRWPLLAEHLQTDPTAVRFFGVPPEWRAGPVPTELASLFEDPPEELRAVMNHVAGPLDASTIRKCSGQEVHI